MQVKVFWNIQSLGEMSPSFEWLHHSEMHILAGFKFVKKRNDWLLGRWTAKNLVWYCHFHQNVDIKLTDIQILPAKEGTPIAYYHAVKLPLVISLSHRENTCLSVLTKGNDKIGCDLEIVENRSQAFIQDYFTTNEQKFMLSFPDISGNVLPNLFWSAKESTLKALRIGLRTDTRNVDVSLEKFTIPEEWNNFSVRFIPDDLSFYGKWKVKDKMIFTIVGDRPDFTLSEVSLKF